MKKILILGSGGYLGSFLCSFLKNNFKIISHYRKKISKLNNIFKHSIIGNITNQKTVNQIVDVKPDIIIYTISLDKYESEKNLKKSFKVNVEPITNLLSEIKKKKIKSKIFYISTVQVYGNKFKNKIIRENQPKNPVNIYSLTHSICEDILISQGKTIGYKILRLSNSFGLPGLVTKKTWKPFLNEICLSSKRKKFIKLKSNKLEYKDFIPLETVGLAIKSIINSNNNCNEIINLCSGKSISTFDAAKRVSQNSYHTKKIRLKYNNILNICNCFKYDNTKLRKYLKNTKFNFDQEINKFLRLI